MPEVICTTVYQFPELSEAAKEKARSWYREIGPHYDWWDAVYEDFERVCEILGIRLKTTPVRLMGGGTRAKPCIWFSGFWSQGDGACFEGYWSYAKGAAARIRDYAPQDTTLHGIADRLQAIQRRNFYQLTAEAATVAATTTNTPFRSTSRATARLGSRRPRTPRRLLPRRCAISPAGSTASLRPNTTTSPRTRPSRKGSPSTSILSQKEGGGSGEAHPSKNFPDRTLETYVDVAYISTRHFRRRPCSVSTTPPAQSMSATRPG